MKRYLSWLDRMMLAVTFAENDCPEMAENYVISSENGCVSVPGSRVIGGGMRQGFAGRYRCR